MHLCGNDSSKIIFSLRLELINRSQFWEPSIIISAGWKRYAHLILEFLINSSKYYVLDNSKKTLLLKYIWYLILKDIKITQIRHKKQNHWYFGYTNWRLSAVICLVSVKANEEGHLEKKFWTDIGEFFTISFPDSRSTVVN